MDNREKENKLSSYIDSLNNERKPMEHGNNRETDDIEEILETVRRVRSLKKPSRPDNKFSERLNEKLNEEILKESSSRKHKNRWFYEMASAAAAALLIITFNITGPLRQPNMVYAMEQAYNGSINKPQVEVKYDLNVEEADQKSVDAGHSPWKLDPVFVAQVFVSLKICPEGITGDYPIKYEELKMIKINGIEAVVEVNSAKSLVKRVYLKRLIRQDNTGIWTVIGYDPAK